MRTRGLLLALLLLAVSCTQPRSREYFLKSDGSGEYSFTLEMTDTLQGYDISFFTSIDRPLLRPDTLNCFPLQSII